MSEVYVIFEERQLSCDPAYDDDGFMVIWDSEELGRNLTTCELIEKVKECCEQTYYKLQNYLNTEFGLMHGEDNKNLDDSYFTEVFNFFSEEIGNVFYKFHYQNVSTIKEVYSTEESAKEMCEYYKKNIAFKNRYYYVKYNVRGK